MKLSVVNKVHEKGIYESQLQVQQMLNISLHCYKFPEAEK